MRKERKTAPPKHRKIFGNDSILPDILIHSIVSFCDYKDALKISTLNRRFLDHIEAFSANQLAKIRENHQVDPSWNYRLGMIATLDMQASNQASRDSRNLPATLSNRHMLKCARKTHLYSLGGRDCSDSTVHLACLPDGNTLLSAGLDRRIHVWDLKSQQCIRSFEQPNHADICALHYFAGRIATSSEDALHILTIEGVHLFSVSFPNEYINQKSLLPFGNRLLVASYVEDQDDGIEITTNLPPFFCLVDILSGQRIQNVQQNWVGCLVSEFIRCANVGEWFVVMCGVSDDIAANESVVRQAKEQAGIYVLNQSSLMVESHFCGMFETMAALDDGSSIVAVDRDGLVGILKVESGILVRIRSFPFPVPLNRRELHTWVVSGPFLYDVAAFGFNGRGEDDHDIKVIDIAKGAIVKTMYFSKRDAPRNVSLFPFALETNGKELFCGFNAGLSPRVMHTINAYPL